MPKLYSTGGEQVTALPTRERLTEIAEYAEEGRGEDVGADLARCARLVAALLDEARVVEAMARKLDYLEEDPHTAATSAYRSLVAHLTRDTTDTEGTTNGR